MKIESLDNVSNQKRLYKTDGKIITLKSYKEKEVGSNHIIKKLYKTQKND